MEKYLASKVKLLCQNKGTLSEGPHFDLPGI